MVATRKTAIIIAIGLVAVAIAAWAITRDMDAPRMPVYPTLTEEEALRILEVAIGCKPEGEEGQYRSCAVEIAQEGNRASVTVTHDGFFDDSVRASRIDADLIYEDGAWERTDFEETYRCQEGRGHQEFTSELCV